MLEVVRQIESLMESIFARRTIKEYLPVIEAIYASLDVSYQTHTVDIEKRDSLRFVHLERDFGTGKLLHAGNIISVWLRSSRFKVEGLNFHKIDKEAKWADFFKILDTQIVEYQNGAAIIQLTISSAGRTVREISGKELVHDFADEGMKKEIIFNLLDRRGFMQNLEIQNIVGSKSKESVAKIIGKINSSLGSALQLPPKQHIIESKRGSGYRINPIYNVIRLD